MSVDAEILQARRAVAGAHAELDRAGVPHNGRTLTQRIQWLEASRERLRKQVLMLEELRDQVVPDVPPEDLAKG